jgi:hypothetical protein
MIIESEAYTTLRQQFFRDREEWVRHASSYLTARAGHPRYNDGRKNSWERFTAICFDTKGRICANGGDFKRAEDDGAFPIRWVWPDQVPALALAQIAEPVS